MQSAMLTARVERQKTWVQVPDKSFHCSGFSKHLTSLVLVSPNQGVCVTRLNVANEIIQPTGEGNQPGLNIVETNKTKTREN